MSTVFAVSSRIGQLGHKCRSLWYYSPGNYKSARQSNLSWTSVSTNREFGTRLFRPFNTFNYSVGITNYKNNFNNYNYNCNYYLNNKQFEFANNIYTINKRYKTTDEYSSGKEGGKPTRKLPRPPKRSTSLRVTQKEKRTREYGVIGEGDKDTILPPPPPDKRRKSKGRFSKYGKKLKGKFFSGKRTDEVSSSGGKSRGFKSKKFTREYEPVRAHSDKITYENPEELLEGRGSMYSRGKKRDKKRSRDFDDQIEGDTRPITRDIEIEIDDTRGKGIRSKGKDRASTITSDSLYPSVVDGPRVDPGDTFKKQRDGDKKRKFDVKRGLKLFEEKMRKKEQKKQDRRTALEQEKRKRKQILDRNITDYHLKQQEKEEKKRRRRQELGLPEPKSKRKSKTKRSVGYHAKKKAKKALHAITSIRLPKKFRRKKRDQL